MPVIINHGSVAFPLDMAAQVGSYKAAQDRQDEEWRRRQFEEQQRRNRIMEQRQQEADQIAQQRIDESIAHNRETERLGGSRIDATVSGQVAMGARQQAGFGQQKDMAVLKQSQLLERRALDAEDRGDFSEAHDLRVAKQRAVDWEKRSAENALNREFKGQESELGRTATESRFTRSQAANALRDDLRLKGRLSQQEYARHLVRHRAELSAVNQDLNNLNRQRLEASKTGGGTQFDGLIAEKMAARKELIDSINTLPSVQPTTQPSTILPAGPARLPPAPGTPMQPDETGYDNQPPPSPDRYTSAAGDQGIPAPEGTVISGPNGQTFQKRNGQWVPYP